MILYVIKLDINNNKIKINLKRSLNIRHNINFLFTKFIFLSILLYIIHLDTIIPLSFNYRTINKFQSDITSNIDFVILTLNWKNRHLQGTKILANQDGYEKNDSETKLRCNCSMLYQLSVQIERPTISNLILLCSVLNKVLD